MSRGLGDVYKRQVRVLAPDRRVSKSQVAILWEHLAACIMFCILEMDRFASWKANRHIPSAKAVVAPSWAINALNSHISQCSYNIPIALWETQTRALPLTKIQAF